MRSDRRDDEALPARDVVACENRDVATITVCFAPQAAMNDLTSPPNRGHRQITA